MAGRKFTDRDGKRWEVRARSRSEWAFEPDDDTHAGLRYVRPPSYEADPFELSIEELQKLLDSAPPPPPRKAQSPFQD